MKKILTGLLILVSFFTLSACGGGSNYAESTAEALQNKETVTESSAEISDSGQSNLENEEKAIVVYFSCTGNTRAAAEEIAKQTGADIYEIIPEQPYTDDDLNYSDDNCRANREMNDDTARPAISGSLGNIDSYDSLYIGYPIWWGTMPKIMNTFFDTYDLRGKTLLPFCTSGGSGIDKSVDDIKTLEPDADVKNGLQIGSSNADNCENDVAKWLEDNK